MKKFMITFLCLGFLVLGLTSLKNHLIGKYVLEASQVALEKISHTCESNETSLKTTQSLDDVLGVIGRSTVTVYYIAFLGLDQGMDVSHSSNDHC